MPELFTSHSWCLDLPLVISISALVCGAALSNPSTSYSDIGDRDTYNQALWWGAAHPGDPPGTNGCFSSNRTFETCCVSWTGELPTCWEKEQGAQMEMEGSNLTYDACCVAKHHWAPRSFSCDGKGMYWQRLYQTLALFRVFTELNETPLNQASPQECLVGGVLASILSLIHIGYDRQYRTQEQKDMDYERAEGLLLVLFSSPVTLEEVLVSGWPLFLSLDLFRADEGFLQMARQRLPLQTPGEHTLKWSEVVVKSIQNGQGSRIAMEPVIRLGNLAVEEVLWKAFVSIHILYIYIFYNYYYVCIYIYCIFSLMMTASPGTLAFLPPFRSPRNSITKSGDVALAQLVPILTALVAWLNTVKAVSFCTTPPKDNCKLLSPRDQQSHFVCHLQLDLQETNCSSK